MREYTFDLVLDHEPTMDEIEAVGAWISEDGPAPEGVQDVTLAVSAGVPLALCTVDAASLDEAVRLVVPALRERGLDVERVELDREGLSVLEAA